MVRGGRHSLYQSLRPAEQPSHPCQTEMRSQPDSRARVSNGKAVAQRLDTEVLRAQWYLHMAVYNRKRSRQRVGGVRRDKLKSPAQIWACDRKTGLQVLTNVNG